MKEAEAEIVSPRRERQAVIELKRLILLEPKFLLNLDRYCRGVFEDKYYHLVNIGCEFYGLTGDHSLDNILFEAFLTGESPWKKSRGKRCGEE